MGTWAPLWVSIRFFFYCHPQRSASSLSCPEGYGIRNQEDLMRTFSCTLSIQPPWLLAWLLTFHLSWVTCPELLVGLIDRSFCYLPGIFAPAYSCLPWMMITFCLPESESHPVYQEVMSFVVLSLFSFLNSDLTVSAICLLESWQEH